MKNAWLVRPVPHGIRRIDEFKEQKIVALGWPNIGDLTGKTREQLKEILSKKPYELNGLALGNTYATFDIFVNQIQVGDLVLIPDGADIYFAEVLSDYFLESSVDNDEEGYPHQRKIKLLGNTSRTMLSKELRYSLKVHRTTANLSRHEKEIDALAHDRTYEPAEEKSVKEIKVQYPLRPDFVVDFTIPTDITSDEANRLSMYFSSLYFTK